VIVSVENEKLAATGGKALESFDQLFNALGCRITGATRTLIRSILRVGFSTEFGIYELKKILDKRQ